MTQIIYDFINNLYHTDLTQYGFKKNNLITFIHDDNIIWTKPIGCGTHGAIIKINDTQVYKIFTKKENCIILIPNALFREIINILYLQLCSNIIQIDKIFITKISSGYTMKHYTNNLYSLIKIKLDKKQIKNILFQLVYILAYLQSRFIHHRDIKPGNIMVEEFEENNKEFEDINKVNKNYKIILIDFGLSIFNYANHFTKNNNEIQTLWYRTPELALHTHFNNETMDMWSLGVIALELLTNNHGIFSASNERQLIRKIINYIGMPKEQEILNIILEKKIIKIFPLEHKKVDIKQLCIKYIDDELCGDFLEKILVWNHLERLSPIDALQHPYFSDNINNANNANNISTLHSDPIQRLQNIPDIIIDYKVLNNKYLSQRQNMILKFTIIYKIFNFSFVDFVLIIKYIDVLHYKCINIKTEYLDFILISMCYICKIINDSELSINKLLILLNTYQTDDYTINTFIHNMNSYSDENFNIMINNILDNMVDSFNITFLGFYEKIFPELFCDECINKYLYYFIHISLLCDIILNNKTIDIFSSIVHIISTFDFGKENENIITINKKLNVKNDDIILEILLLHNKIIKNENNEFANIINEYSNLCFFKII